MWTPAALVSESRLWQGAAWRVVECQSRVSTITLVDTLEEQTRLEEILETSKPQMPVACQDRHYLIATPFRYRPYPHGSRFRRSQQEDGCYYAAETPETAIAEAAFYHLLFYLDAPDACLPGRPIEKTAFLVQVYAMRAINLTLPPFADHGIFEHPTDYSSCQDFADVARVSDVRMIRYRSIRDPQRGMNIAVLDPNAIISQEPLEQQTWHLSIKPDAIQAFREMPKTGLEFPFSNWRNDARIGAYMAQRG